MNRRLLLGALVIVLVAVGLGIARAATGPEPLRRLVGAPQSDAPTLDGWPTVSARDAGFRPARLRASARAARRAGSTCFAVVRDGELVGDWNWKKVTRTTGREVFSVTKSVAATLVGIAARDGDLRLDDPVADYVPQWRGTPSASVTVRQLLSNTSGRFWSAPSDYSALVQAKNRSAYAVGLTQQYDPGSAWAYNNAAIQVLDRVLRKATGMRTATFAQERLFEPLGMTHSRLTPDASGRSTNVFFGLQTTCLDLARFVGLYLGEGRADGTRILSKKFVRQAVGASSSPFNAAYGYLWWLNRPGLIRGPLDPVDATGQPVTPHTGQQAAGAPEDMFAALGLGGQVALADPGSDTIVVRLGPGSLSMSDRYSFADAARVVTWASR